MVNDSENFNGFSSKRSADAFEHASKLFQENPEAFEEYRLKTIEECISRLPAEKQQRARGLQFRIDNEMRKIKNPLVRATKMNSMMIESLIKLDGVFKVATGKRKLEGPTEKADVLPFARKTPEE